MHVGYVLEGTITLTRDGEQPVTLADKTFFVPAGAAHHVATSGDARILATYFVEKGKPIAVAAQ